MQGAKSDKKIRVVERHEDGPQSGSCVRAHDSESLAVGGG
jgi:hypothetical protein